MIEQFSINLHEIKTKFNNYNSKIQLEAFNVKSYIKIYGPPVLKAIQALQSLAVDTPEVCIMDTIIANDIRSFSGVPVSTLQSYFQQMGVGEISVERCDNIISKSEGVLGEYDFVYDWFAAPSGGQVNDLIAKIDEALEPLGCKYTITTKE